MDIEKIAIAPMLDWTDRHYRYFMRQISKSSTLYTEMVVADAIIHGNADRLLEFNTAEQPLVLQLGGSDPHKLAIAGKMALAYGYNEINLNCGCPSERVQSGSFGACLMREPDLVSDCVKALQDSTGVNITVKHRIGIDYDYDYQLLAEFVRKMVDVNCTKIIVHARNAVLKGLSPKQNREVPPLKYEFVYQLKQDFPSTLVMINGGIKTVSEINQHLAHVDSVMIGREAYYNPYLFANFDNLYYAHDNIPKTRNEVALAMLPYLQAMLDNGHKLHHATRHMIGLYHGCSKAKLWRQTLTTQIIHSNNLDDYVNLIQQMIE